MSNVGALSFLCQLLQIVAAIHIRQDILSVQALGVSPLRAYMVIKGTVLRTECNFDAVTLLTLGFFLHLCEKMSNFVVWKRTAKT